MTNSDWMDINEAAQYLGMHKKTVERKARLGYIKCGKSGREYRFKKEKLDDYIITNGNASQ